MLSEEEEYAREREIFSEERLQQRIDSKTKPLGSLGVLEKIAFQIGSAHCTHYPSLRNPVIVVLAGDHGIAREGVSAYPQEVTAQMVFNFLNRGAAINVFCKQNNIALEIVDAGVNHVFDDKYEETNALYVTKIAMGTKSFLKNKAMTRQQLESCFIEGRNIVNRAVYNNRNVIGFGEMGIGNTSAATMLMSYICNLPIEQCVGRGTGLNDSQLENKIQILNQAKRFHGDITDPKQLLYTFAGFEMAQMCAAMLEAYQHNMIILVDGFICSAVYLVAHAINPLLEDNAIFCHLSDEHGHQNLLHFLGVEPILKLNMRLGEGSGCAVAYPIINSAVSFLEDMASFESAGVSEAT
jgi:nicotinate-nucleotide--dimethylbenzimidazole phosphoribosyltransferase